MNHRQIVTQFAAGVAVAVLASATQAGFIYVDDDNCPGPGDGSYENPYCSIQTAIDNAMDTDDILVQPGTYYETIDFFGKAVTLRSLDGPNVTIIDGQQLGAVVVCGTSEGPDTVLEGFTITGGTEYGGMRINDSSPTVTNCKFFDNLSEYGGGMRNVNSSPAVTDCTFSGNEAVHAGGMWNNNSNPTVTNCTFSGNLAENWGGGMRNHGSSPTVTNCTFSGNSANSAGGGVFNDDSSPEMTNCTFTDNTADHGGGMYNRTSSPTLTDCTFSENYAVYTGGGMRNWDSSSPTVTNCTFTENSAGAMGGGMYIEPGDVECQVTDSAFCGNSPDNINGCVVWENNSMSPVCPPPVCPGDNNGDGVVNVSDFLYMLTCWGACP